MKTVIQCIKGNNNKCGFGYRYKKDQYVTYSGKPTDEMDKAYVYDDSNDDTDCAIYDIEGYEKYFQAVPIKLVPVPKKVVRGEK